METVTVTVSIELNDLMHLHKIIGIYEQALRGVQIASGTSQAAAIATNALAQDSLEVDKNVN